jgi:hypothetical protein
MTNSDGFERPTREPRPAFSAEEPIAERLVRVVMNLAAELAVVRERLDTVERLLAATGSVTQADIEACQLDEVAEGERRAWRETYVRRIFADLQAEVDAAQVEMQTRDAG